MRESEHFCEAGSNGKMLQWFYDLGSEILTLLEMKGIEVSELINDNWIRGRSFLVDLTTYLNETNLKLHGENQLVHQLHSCRCARPGPVFKHRPGHDVGWTTNWIFWLRV